MLLLKMCGPKSKLVDTNNWLNNLLFLSVVFLSICLFSQQDVPGLAERAGSLSE